MGCGAASTGDWFPTFRDIVVVSFSGVEIPVKSGIDVSTLEDATITLSRNLGRQSVVTRRHFARLVVLII